MKPETRSACRATVAFGVAMVVASCGAGGIRPRFEPFPQAMADTIRGSADSITLRIGELLAAEGIEVRHLRPAEGYAETKWFDVMTKRTTSSMSLDTDSVVRLRFWTDLATVSECLVVGEAVKRRILDPSLPERETEEPVPPEHPATDVVRRIIAGLKERNAR
ncbi:MAG: hypothetical protein AMS18_06455 [Gemmatimonas sp. SG8_17]|nr:MAG: hypothetical protein AMS18_06455 [Gemmatimonas sp. SG8_17]